MDLNLLVSLNDLLADRNFTTAAVRFNV
ncbi:hypothetical protein MDG893_13059 [Marinobacter algicola DG893]|uniref:HTH lysR-type domain-containing protein n=1 Tax=Marinobacter algicola DG893 TaxID=443152 RepID=A6F4A0_9GAMM|nr:hypothetical protein MDG893_13059 [Marinobacter algicola DG893]